MIIVQEIHQPHIRRTVFLEDHIQSHIVSNGGTDGRTLRSQGGLSPGFGCQRAQTFQAAS